MILNSPYISGSLTVTGNTTIQGQLTVTGSLSGTASLASNALLLQGTGSTGFATTASLLQVSSSQQQLSSSFLTLTASFNAVSASQQQISASYIALSASYNTFSGSASTRITVDSASLLQVSASYIALSGSYNVFSGSASTRITANSSSIQQVSASLLQVSASYIALSGSYNTYSSSVSTRTTQIENVYATTGSNSFRANQSITGSLVVSSTITAQTLIVQTVTSSIVYSSGSNLFGSALSNTQTFTGSLNVTGSSHAIFGNVGINTTAPTVALQVYSTGSSSSNVIAEFYNGDYGTGTRNFIRLRNGATIGSTTSAYFGQGQDQKTYFYNNDFSRPGDIVITNSGKIGINRSDSNYNLDISDNTAGTLNISNRNSSATANKCSALLFSGYDTVCGEKLSGAIVGESDTSNYYGGHLKFLISTGNIYAASSLVEAMRITSNAYVGINITSACKHLEVGGTIRTTASPSAYYRDMTYLGDTYQFGSSETGDNVDFRICGGSTWSTGGNFRWFTQAGNTTPSERMRITAGGSVGISATNPRTQLDVGDIHDGVGGTTFCAFLVEQGTWATFACITDNDTNVITDITYVNNNDSNRSGALLARWAYNATCVGTYIVNCGWNWSQNINTFGIRNNGGALQICLSGGGNGYRVQARTQGARATG